MRLLRRKKGPVATLPAVLKSALPAGEGYLAAVPVDPRGEQWLVATTRGLRLCSTQLEATSDASASDSYSPTQGELGSAESQGIGEAAASKQMPEFAPWDRVSRATWDADKREFSIALLGQGVRILSIPAILGRSVDGRWVDFEVDESIFARTLRQQVERAIVHFVRHTLSNGVRLGVSVRRKPDGELYIVTDPARDADELAAVSDEVRRLLRQVSNDVGLPTV